MKSSKFVIFRFIFLSFSLLLFLWLVFIARAAWQEPSEPFPAGNPGAPLDESSVDQGKSGGITFGTSDKIKVENGRILFNPSGSPNGQIFWNGTVFMAREGTLTNRLTLDKSGFVQCGDATTGKVYWNGTKFVCAVDQAGGGGGGDGNLPPGAVNQTLRYNGTSWESSSVLTNDGLGLTGTFLNLSGSIGASNFCLPGSAPEGGCISTWPTGSGTGDISSIITAADSGLAGGAASGDINLSLDKSALTDCDDATEDKVYWNGNKLVCATDQTQGGENVLPNPMAGAILRGVSATSWTADNQYVYIKPSGTGAGAVGIGTGANVDANYKITTSGGIKAESNLSGQPTGYFKNSNNGGYALVTDGGNVGIGTTAPTHKLDVTGDVRWSGTLQGGSVPWVRLSVFPAACEAGQAVQAIGTTLTCVAIGGGSGGIGGGGADNYLPRWNGTNALENSAVYQDDTNKVGIGTINPLFYNAPLAVVSDGTGNSRVITAFAPSLSAGSYAYIGLGKDLSVKNSAWLAFRYSGAGSNSNFTSLGLYGVGDILVVNGSGNVGIGTTSPNAKLHVVGGFKASNVVAENIQATAFDVDGNIILNNGSQFTLRPSGGGESYWTSWDFTSTQTDTCNGDNSAVITCTGYNSVPLCYDRANVYIGNPPELQGQATRQITCAPTSGGYALKNDGNELKFVDGTGDNTLVLQQDGVLKLPYSNSYINFGGTGGTNGYGFRDNSGTLQFKNNNGSWTNIGGGGGGGAVSSVSNSDGTLTVSPTTGAVVVSLAPNHPNVWTTTQTFYGGSPQLRWGNVSAVGALTYSGANPVIQALGTADLLFYGNTNERMRLTNAGNLGIGTASPAYKLDVQGGQVNASGGLCINGDCKTAWSQVGGGGGAVYIGVLVGTSSIVLAPPHHATGNEHRRCAGFEWWEIHSYSFSYSPYTDFVDVSLVDFDIDDEGTGTYDGDSRFEVKTSGVTVCTKERSENDVDSPVTWNCRLTFTGNLNKNFNLTATISIRREDNECQNNDRWSGFYRVAPVLKTQL